MNILVGCEFSGIVRDAFRNAGHEAWSCDLEDVEPEGEYPNYHLYGDLLWWLDGSTGPIKKWDMLIAFPPCTYLTRAGARWLYHPDDRHLQTWNRRPHPNYPNRLQHKMQALEFVQKLMSAPVHRIAIENPAGAISSCIRKPDQVIQPWQHGHGEEKKICLWLKNLPLLIPTNTVPGRAQRIHKMGPSPNRGKERSRFYPGIAQAMAAQWGIVA